MRLFSELLCGPGRGVWGWRDDIRRNDTYHNDARHNDAKHEDAQHNNTQHNYNTQHNWHVIKSKECSVPLYRVSLCWMSWRLRTVYPRAKWLKSELKPQLTFLFVPRVLDKCSKSIRSTDIKERSLTHNATWCCCGNITTHIRHQCSKTTALSCRNV